MSEVRTLTPNIMNIRCSICGCTQYTKSGNTAGGRWTFKCSNGHRWVYTHLRTNEPFPWREDDYYHPKYWHWQDDRWLPNWDVFSECFSEWPEIEGRNQR